MKRRVFSGWVVCLAVCIFFGGFSGGMAAEARGDTPPEATAAPFSPADAVTGELWVREISLLDTWDMEAYVRLFRERWFSDGQSMFFFSQNREGTLIFNAKDLDTLESTGTGDPLYHFEEKEDVLRVVERFDTCYVLTTRALYRVNSALELTARTPLPPALMEMPRYISFLEGFCDVSPQGSFLCFEATGKEAGIYLCAMQPDAKPYRLLPGTIMTDAHGYSVEGYWNPQFISEDKVAVYRMGEKERVAREVFDTEGNRLYNTFVFNRLSRADHTGGVMTIEDRKIAMREVESAHGMLLIAPDSVNDRDFFYFDYASLTMRRLEIGRAHV